MNILLWILQVFLALHTAAGAMWKFSNPARTVPSLKAIPHSIWLGLSWIEFLCVIGFLLPAFGKRYAIAAPVAAIVIALEMLFFCGVHAASGSKLIEPVMYWLVVAALCAFTAYGRGSALRKGKTAKV